jgi:hypothetical protein
MVSEEERPPAAEGGTGAPEQAAAPAEGPGPQAIPLGALPTADVLVWFLSFLAAKAWEGMGLVPSPSTNKIQKNMDEARLAIDAYAAILDLLRTSLEESPRREMQSLLTTLRLNFVEKSSG